MKDIESVIVLRKGDSDWEIDSSHLVTEQAEEAVRKRFPHQLGELTVEASKNELPQSIKDNLPDHLKGNVMGVVSMPVYAFGREKTDDGRNILHLALHRNENGNLKYVFGVNVSHIEKYETLHKFYQI